MKFKIGDKVKVIKPYVIPGGIKIVTGTIGVLTTQHPYQSEFFKMSTDGKEINWFVHFNSFVKINGGNFISYNPKNILRKKHA